MLIPSNSAGGGGILKRSAETRRLSNARASRRVTGHKMERHQDDGGTTQVRHADGERSGLLRAAAVGSEPRWVGQLNRLLVPRQDLDGQAGVGVVPPNKSP